MVPKCEESSPLLPLSANRLGCFPATAVLIWRQGQGNVDRVLAGAKADVAQFLATVFERILFQGMKDGVLLLLNHRKSALIRECVAMIVRLLYTWIL